MKPAVRYILKWAIAVPLISFVSGLTVYLIMFGFELNLLGAIWAVVNSLIYSTIMVGTQAAAGYLADRFIPLTNRREVAGHVAVQGVATALSFVIATLAAGAFGFVFNRGALIIIGMVAIIGSMLANGARYLERFHRRVRAAEQAALNAQLTALRAQINPHFLFNSLNSIAALIRSRPAEAERVTESLADLFRYSLRASERPVVTLGEEVESIETYLEVERARFRERLVVEISVPDALYDEPVPSLLLQPLVENAVKHGVGRTEGICTVSVIARRDADAVRIRVEDTGPGFPTTDLSILSASGAGLANVRERLRHQYGDAARMTVEQNCVELRIPASLSPSLFPEPSSPYPAGRRVEGPER